MKSKIFLLIAAAIFLTLRLIHLRERLVAASDQGAHLLAIHDIIVHHTISLLGPSSSFAVNGRAFFFGPITYYLPIPVVLLFGWNVLAVSYFLIVLQLLAFLVALLAIAKTVKDRSIPLFFAIFIVVSPVMIKYSQFLWNPNLMLPISLLLLAVLLRLTNERAVVAKAILVGVLLGLGMQAHFSYILAIGATVIWFGKTKRLTAANILALGGGFIIGFFPLVLFEIKHDFYNLRTIFLYLTTRDAGGNDVFVHNLLEHYRLSLLPFVFYGLAVILARLEKKVKYLGKALLAVFVVISLISVLSVPSFGPMQQPGWNFNTISTIRDIVIASKKTDFNIVDFLTGDARALYLRALLTWAKDPPMSERDYPSSKFLFVYSRFNSDQVMNAQLWEIEVSRPMRLAQSWSLGQGIFLYLFERRPNPPQQELHLPAKTF